MKRVYLVFGTLLAWLSLVAEAWAEVRTMTMSASSGTITRGSCNKFSDGAVTGHMNCTIVFNIPLEAGRTIQSVTYYYYDNASPQYFFGKVGQISSSTFADEVMGVTVSDNTTHDGVQFYVVNINKPILATYAYYVYVVVSNDTALRTVRINYY